MAEAGNGQHAEQALTFEQAYAELEQTAQALQQGQLSLDETLRLYERGSYLSRYCLEKLEGVEMKITQLLAHADGTYSTKQIASERDVAPPAAMPLPERQTEAAEEAREDSPDEAFLKEQRELFD